MKLRVLSDLHIEGYPFEIPWQPDDARTVLVLAGDIGNIEGHGSRQLQDFLCAAGEQFRAVIMVLGNHEWYHAVWPDALQTIKGWELPENVHILEQESVRIDHVTFHGATLWTDYDGNDPISMIHAHNAMVDYRQIRTSKLPQGSSGTPTPMAKFSPLLALEAHREARSWLTKRLAMPRAPGDRVVVVTHHGVSRRSIHPRYADNPINGAFVTDLDELLIEGRVDLAIHGHIHDSMRYLIPYEGGAVQIVANPRGYTNSPHTQENKKFDAWLSLEI